MLYRTHASQLFHSQSFLFQKSCVVRFHELKHSCRLRQKGAQTILFAKILLERKHMIVSKNRGKTPKGMVKIMENPYQKIPWIWWGPPLLLVQHPHMNVEKTLRHCHWTSMNRCFSPCDLNHHGWWFDSKFVSTQKFTWNFSNTTWKWKIGSWKSSQCKGNSSSFNTIIFGGSMLAFWGVHSNQRSNTATLSKSSGITKTVGGAKTPRLLIFPQIS